MNAPARPPLTLIVCEGGLGRLTAGACVSRWQVANGMKSLRAHADDDTNAQLRASRCNGCEHGRARAVGAGIAIPTTAQPRVVRARPHATARPCAYAPCGRSFVPVRGNHVYCGEPCNHAEKARRYKLAHASETRTRPCKGGCGKDVRIVGGQERWCYAPCKPHKYATPPLGMQRDGSKP